MKKSSKIITATLGIICIILTATLIGTIIQYNSTIVTKEQTLGNLENQLEQKNNINDSLNLQIATKNLEIENITNQKNQIQNWLNNNIKAYDNQIEELQNQILTDQQTKYDLLNQISAHEQTIEELQNQISTSQQTIISLQNQLTTINQQVDSLTFEKSELEEQVDKLKSALTFNKSHLQTLVFHVCEKNWTDIPDVNYTYNEILSLNNGTYNIFLLPEFEEHKNWTSELEWIATNFKGIPIMLETFSSSEGDSPTKLSIENLAAALAVCDLKCLRIAEAISWYMEDGSDFPESYVKSILDWCRNNTVEILWTEWKTDHEETNTEVFTKIQSLIEGYEDIVTVSFSTNSGETEPSFGFLSADEMFQHWGASIQAWYWNTTYGEDLLNMPISLLIQHTLAAKNIGAEIIQFEPYWYFFNYETGEITENLEVLFKMLK
jgi:peptidoglycan hydrolase CwlO-like protein